VAEQLAFDQAARQRGAVDAHQTVMPAPAGVVDGLSEQLLAGAGLAEQQHRGVEGCHPLDPGTRLLQRHAVANDAARRTGRPRLVVSWRRLGRGFDRARRHRNGTGRANPLEPYQSAPQNFTHQAEALDHRLAPLGVTLTRADHQPIDHALTQYDRHRQAPHDPAACRLRAVAARGVAQAGGRRERGARVARQALNQPRHAGDVRVGAARVRRQPPRTDNVRRPGAVVGHERAFVHRECPADLLERLGQRRVGVVGLERAEAGGQLDGQLLERLQVLVCCGAGRRKGDKCHMTVRVIKASAAAD